MTLILWMWTPVMIAIIIAITWENLLEDKQRNAILDFLKRLKKWTNKLKAQSFTTGQVY